PVAGSSTAKVLPDPAERHSPPTSSSFGTASITACSCASVVIRRRPPLPAFSSSVSPLRPLVGARRSRGHGVQLPAVGNASELVFSSILESDARSGDEVHHRPGRQPLPRLRARADALADVDRQPPDVVTHRLDFARVEPDAHFQAQLAGAVPNGEPAANRTRGPVERREDPVAHRLDLVSAEARELSAGGGVVRVENVAPAAGPAPSDGGRPADRGARKD